MRAAQPFTWVNGYQCTFAQGTTSRLANVPHLNQSDEASGLRMDQPGIEDINNTVILNVGGVSHEVMARTLKRVPNTRLSQLHESDIHFRNEKGEYYFDRHPGIFSAILNYYRTGELHMPHDICGSAFKLELEYWQLNESDIQECCWIRYNVDKDTKRMLEFLSLREQKENEAPSSTTRSSWQRIREKAWKFLEYPLSSRGAKVYASASFLAVLLSIFVFCAETHPAFKIDMTDKDYAYYYGISLSELYLDWYGTNQTDLDKIDFSEHPRRADNDTEFVEDDDLMVPHPVLTTIDRVLIVFFTLDLILRFVFCPKKKQFFTNGLNISDLLSVMPFYVERIVEVVYIQEKYSRTVVDALFVLKILRIFRMMRLLRHYKGLQVLVLTLTHSWKEIILLTVFLFVSIIIFSSLIYFANKDANFSSIPKCFWWAVVTMTTVGYGDVYPTTKMGYVVGSFCTLTGVLVIGFTVPTLVNNFLLFYNHVEYRKEFIKHAEYRASVGQRGHRPLRVPGIQVRAHRR